MRRIVSDSLQLIAKSIPTGKDRDYTEIIEDMAQLSHELIKEAGLTTEDIEYIGIGSPGVCDRRMEFCYMLIILISMMCQWQRKCKHISLPVFIENDANCAALGESLAGAAKDVL